MKSRVQKSIGVLLILLAVFLSFDNVSYAIYTGETRTEDDYYSVEEKWDYTEIINDEEQMSSFGDYENGYLPTQNDSKLSTKLTVSTGAGVKTKLLSSENQYEFSDGSSGTAAVFRADEEHPWTEDASIDLKLARSVDALFNYFTLEMGFRGNVPKRWKLQVSFDDGKTFNDVENSVVELKEEGKTEVLFKRVAFPKPPFGEREWLDNYEECLKIPYTLRLAAVSDKSIENSMGWEDSSSGEICIKEIRFEQAVLYPATSEPPVSVKTEDEIFKGKTAVLNGVLYEVIVAGDSPEVEYMLATTKKSSITIPDTVVINGVTCKVTTIAKNAFKDNTKLKKVTLGKNVTTIKKNAFRNCKKLKTIVIKSKNLNTIGKKAFSGISKKAKVSFPSGMKKAKRNTITKKLKNAGMKGA